MHKCKIPECNRPHYGLGLCHNHYAKNWRIKNPERAKDHDRKRAVANAKRSVEWKLRNKERVSRYNGEWNRANAGAKNAHTSRRKAEQLKATPYWADLSAIRKIYEACPKGVHVDHIIPLRGDNVCGLHVDYNLQYLLAEENCRKGNRV